MSRNKAELWKRDRYARLVAVWRSVEAILGDALELPGPRAIQVESSRDPEWDDLVETFVAAPDQKPLRRCWQIKRQNSALSRKAVERLIRALHASTRIDRGCLGLFEDVEVKGVGRMSTLKELCARATQPGADLGALVAALRQEERRWWDFLQRAVGGSDASVFAVLQRLEVEVLGSEAQLEFRTSACLASLFKPPTRDVLEALDVFFAKMSDVSVVTVQLLEEHVLDRFVTKRLPTRNTLRTSRATYLARVHESIDARCVLSGTDLDVPLQDVWVPVHQSSEPHDGGAPRQLRDWLAGTTSPGRVLIVIGNVGTGKTELLHRTAAEIARAAESDPDAPLPVLIDARAMSADGFDRAAHSRWSDVAIELGHLLNASATRWIVFIDGLDEAEGQGSEPLGHVRSRLVGSRLHAVVVATRPPVRRSIPGAFEIWLSPWTPQELDQFIERWEHHDAAAVTALRKALPPATRLTLCDSPLVATLCLVAARNVPTTLRSRAGVYEIVVEQLFETWARDRTQRMGAPVAWHEVARVLRSIALEVARRDRSSITTEELRRLVRREAPDNGEWVRTALSLHFGVLVRRGNDVFDFAFRGLAEFLAGQLLLEQGDSAIAHAAFEPWAEETVRHAIGWAALGDPDRAVALLGALLERERDDDIVRSNTNLRPLLIAVRAAADLGNIAGPVAARLADACVRRLRDETSVWVGDRVAAAVLDLARAGGPCWTALFDQCLDTLCHPCKRPARWYEAQPSREPGYWRPLLFMSDREIRCLAIERLAPWVDLPEVRQDLEWELLDDGWDAGAILPAVAAGMALRGARRDETFTETLELLTNGLNAGKPLLALAAAVAIRHPRDGVDPTLLVAALKGAKADYHYPPEILEDLARDEAGLRALEDGWPQWANVLSWPGPEPASASALDLGPLEPPSSYVRHRLSRTLTSGVHHVDESQRARLLQGRAHGDTLFMLAPECPALIRALLDRPATTMFPYLSPETTVELGRAAAKHDALRDLLIRRWDAITTVEGPINYQDALRGTLMRNYPGQALEHLVVRGDADALRIYVAWLKRFKRALGLESHGPLSPAVLAMESVGAEVRWHVDEALAFASEYRVKGDGERTRLSAVAAGRVLLHFRPLWQDDPAVHAWLETWTREGDTGQFLGALVALKGAASSERFHDLVAERLRREIRLVDGLEADLQLHHFTLPCVLAFAHTAGMAAKIEPELRSLVEAGTRSASHAAAVLLPLLDEHEARQVSERAAEGDWSHDRSELIDEPTRRRLVEAAPEAWAEALEKRLRSTLVPSTGMLIPFFEALPPGLKRRVMSAWLEVASPIELPWCNEGSFRDGLSRPADRIRQILFDTGLEREFAPRDVIL